MSAPIRPFSRMTFGLMACSFAGQAVSLWAQEYSPRVEDRYETAVVEALPVGNEDGSEKRGGWDLGAIISAAYNDNILLTARRPEADTVISVAPGIAYTKGDDNEWQGKGVFIRGGYRPTGVVFLKNSDINRVDHELVLSAGWRGRKTRLSYNGALRKLGDATAEIGGLNDRLEYSNEVRAAWVAREKVALELAAGYDSDKYLDEGFFDSSKAYGEAAIRYVYSPKTEFGLAYQIGRFRVDGSASQRTNQVTGLFKWQPREKIRINLEGGAEYRNTDNGTSINPVLEGRVEWEPREETLLFVNAYSREEASSFFAGQNFSVRGVGAGLSQRLGGRWTGIVQGGLESNRYEQVSGAGQAGRDDKLWFIEQALSRRVGQNSELKLFYRFSENDSSDRSFGYDQRILGLQFNHSF